MGRGGGPLARSLHYGAEAAFGPCGIGEGWLVGALFVLFFCIFVGVREGKGRGGGKGKGKREKGKGTREKNIPRWPLGLGPWVSVAGKSVMGEGMRVVVEGGIIGWLVVLIGLIEVS